MEPAEASGALRSGVAAHSRPTVSDIGEDALVAAVVARLRGQVARPGGGAATVLVGPGDDAAVLGLDGPLVTSTDTLVEGVDFRRDWSSANQVGRKAAVQVLADVEAMGAVPVGLLVALVVPGATPVEWCLGLADGLATEAGAAGAAVLGGDVADGAALVVTGTSFGVLVGTAAPVTRAGARVGDVVALGGPTGASAAGLAALGAGLGTGAGVDGEAATGEQAAALARVLQAHRAPTVDHTAGRRARDAGARALIDVSDGLVRDALRLASASGVVIVLERQQLRPGADLLAVADLLDLLAAQGASGSTGHDAGEWVLTSGEEHAMLACFAPDATLPAGFAAIGRVEAGEPGVTLDGERRVDVGGWTHYGRRP